MTHTTYRTPGRWHTHTWHNIENTANYAHMTFRTLHRQQPWHLEQQANFGPHKTSDWWQTHNPAGVWLGEHKTDRQAGVLKSQAHTTVPHWRLQHCEHWTRRAQAHGDLPLVTSLPRGHSPGHSAGLCVTQVSVSKDFILNTTLRMEIFLFR